MNQKERGFMLLTSKLGNPERKPLTVAKFRTLAERVFQMEKPLEIRELTESDLIPLGYDRQTASHIVQLLSESDLLDRYLYRGRTQGCVPITRVSEQYPLAVRKRLGQNAPGCLWAKGDITLLQNQTVALVGSRELQESNRIFAETAGREVARQGYTLVSGNARGADSIAQQACLEAGGKVISVIADSLEMCDERENMLYLSEDTFDETFSPQRALSRNRVIHSLGYITLVAQCQLEKGGTWDGTANNLQKGWSPVFCFNDGTTAVVELAQRGAGLIDLPQLSNLADLHYDSQSFL